MPADPVQVTAYINHDFDQLEANRMAKFPRIRKIIESGRALMTGPVVISAIAAKLPANFQASMTWQQIVDAMFLAAETAFPAEAALIATLQWVFDLLFTPPAPLPPAP